MEPEARPEELQQQVRILSERVERLEAALGIRHLPPIPPPLPIHQPPSVEEAPPTAPPYEWPPLEPVEPRPARTSGSLEGLVGGRYYLAAGSIVVVIGIGLFLKLGYDQGWFRMTNAWKCIWGALFGMALLTAGERARRSIGALASTGLSSAGLGSLYLACYAAHGFYGLVGPVLAFLMLVGTSLLGIGVSILARGAGVAILAMLGAYLAPFLLHVDHPNVYVIPLHAIALLGVGLALSAWRHAVYWPLRTIAWWGSVVLGSFWLASQGHAYPALALGYIGIFWCAVHAELVMSVRGPAHDAPDEPPVLVRWRSARHAVTSLSTSGWCVLAGVLTLRASPVLPDWFVPGAGAGGAMLLSLTLAGHLRVLRDSPRTDAQRLGAALAMQAGALVITVVALAFTGSAEVIAWLALGLAAAGAGVWMHAPSLCVYALAPLCIATARLLTFDLVVARPGNVPVEVASMIFDRWSMLMFSASGAWAAAALLFLRFPSRSPDPPPRLLARLPVACAAIATATCLLAFLHPETSTANVSMVFMLLSAVISLMSLLQPRLHLDTIGACVLGVALEGWFTAFLLPGWHEMYPATQLIHPGAVAGTLGIVVCAGLAAWHARRAPATMTHARVFLGSAIVLTWVVSSLEVFRLAANFRSGSHAQHGALSVWWGVFAVLLLAGGFRWRNAPSRYIGLALLGVATLKALIVDLADVSPGWRVVSVLGLGLLMLGVALVYVRASARLLSSKEGSVPGGDR